MDAWNLLCGSLALVCLIFLCVQCDEAMGDGDDFDAAAEQIKSE